MSSILANISCIILARWKKLKKSLVISPFSHQSAITVTYSDPCYTSGILQDPPGYLRSSRNSPARCRLQGPRISSSLRLSCSASRGLAYAAGFVAVEPIMLQRQHSCSLERTRLWQTGPADLLKGHTPPDSGATWCNHPRSMQIADLLTEV